MVLYFFQIQLVLKYLLYPNENLIKITSPPSQHQIVRRFVAVLLICEGFCSNVLFRIGVPRTFGTVGFESATFIVIFIKSYLVDLYRFYSFPKVSVQMFYL